MPRFESDEMIESVEFTPRTESDQFIIDVARAGMELFFALYHSPTTVKLMSNSSIQAYMRLQELLRGRKPYTPTEGNELETQG